MTASTALSVTVVSPDTILLRELCWLLRAFGYRVSSCCDVSEHAIWTHGSVGDVLVIDTRTPTPGLWAADEQSSFLYTVGLVGPGPCDAAALNKAGFQDVLRVPVSRGELLARLRAAARRIEFERRLSQRARYRSATSVLTLRGLLRSLPQSRSQDRQAGVLLALGIDLFDLIRRQSGERLADQLLANLEQQVSATLPEGDLCASLDGGIVLAFAHDTETESARQLIESIADRFTGRESLFGKAKWRPTLSATLLTWDEKCSPEELVDQSLTALEYTMHFGGNTILAWAEIEAEIRHRQREMVSGNPFADVIAADVMEPFPTVLSIQQDATLLLEAFARISPPLMPLVDNDGLLLGMADHRLLKKLAPSQGASLRDHLAELEQPVTAVHDSSLAEVFEQFSSDPTDTLVVLRDGRPLGFITREGLASLVEPVGRDTYHQNFDDTDPLTGLVVSNPGVFFPAADQPPAIAVK